MSIVVKKAVPPSSGVAMPEEGEIEIRGPGVAADYRHQLIGATGPTR